MGQNGKNHRTEPRDEKVFTSLYVGEVLTTEHLARMYFPSKAYIKDPNTKEQRHSEGGARVRLHKLRHMGYVLKDSFRPAPGVGPIPIWRLTQRRYKREAKAAGRPGERYDDLPKRLLHHLKTNDLYARIHPRLEEIFRTLPIEEYPSWEWKNESHSHCEFYSEGKNRVHQPDAEVHFPDGQVFFIERQTEDSRKSESVFRQKALSCRDYIRWRQFPKGTAKLLFACDTERDKEYAKTACKEANVASVMGYPEEIVKYLIKKAREVQ